MSCKDCCFWEKYDLEEQPHETPDFGECRRYPPTATSDDQQLWPVTHEDDWCGEFDPK
jgi:hypothetical protein